MRLLFITAFFLFSILSFAQVPSVEVRAAWLTTNWGLDWPTQGTSVSKQKEELQKILDQLQKENFNLVLFQTRAQGRVFYRSKFEPLSEYFNHSDNFDPLAFAIEECHKRGMECHAWLITYPMDKAKIKYTGKGKRRKSTVINNKPNYYKEVNGTWYLDPGRPESRELITSIVNEIVSNYDVDGIHFDYIRYPSNTRKFPDDDTYKKYGNGKSLYDWRRDNITQLVTEVYDKVKAIKKWVQISSSPLGRYRVLQDVAPNDGWTAYETVFQDAGHWMKSGKHDLVFPMMYYREHRFYPFVDDWVANSNGRIVVPGLGVYQMDEQNWSLQDIIEQMKYIRDNKVSGVAYFRTGNILNNLKGIKDSIHTYYSAPAKLPPLTWLDNEAPNSPINLQVYKDNAGNLNIKWDAPQDNEDYTYTVYAYSSEDIDIRNPYNILISGLRSNSYSFPVSIGEFGYYYFVTASDRYHNESVVCFPAYFSHSENEQ
ncbi:family 10 glycosylhydrolase [Dysgonomonas sp. Marseille-P4677]|uniref:glycoside hydrolase family 10 protein n=1 Tax=Dysgonomonas sp. Marseille-P4677 TaxID=2364790 RepID=UPI001914C0C8|nr:family 10 glycosylhydrolase [Dysgonomonas sp. Marseille-P4677]MBK5719393.1 family 10 glycosylhydrolase [Dysgonomonas sp. Marseille-P4677]